MGTYTFKPTMKIKITFLVVLLAFFISIGCEKKSSGDPKYCWEIVDAAGNRLGKLCDRTEKQMVDTFQNPCYYYQLGEEEYCWLIDGSIYIPDAPEDYIKRFIKCYGKTSYTKVECGYCQFWYTRKKEIYKPANTATYSQVRKEYLCGDTVKTLYKGRQVVLRETTDSLIVVEFSNSGSF